MEKKLKPLISVIIPCYNYGNLIQECVESIVAQTYSNWECIIVDDGSLDNTKEIAENFVKSNQRISYYYQQNSGPAVARNYGLTKAKGEFIQFIDADDLIESKKFEIQISIFEKASNCDIVYSSVNYFSDSDKTKLFDNITLTGSLPWMKNLSGHGEVMIKALLSGNIMVINSPLIRMSLFDKLGSFSEDLFFNEDWELWTRFALAIRHFTFDNSPKTMALVRVHQSYSKDIFKMYIYGLLACLKLKNKVKERKYRKIIIPKITYHQRIIDFALIELLRNDKKRAIEQSQFIAGVTKLKRYTTYENLFNAYPFRFCYFYSRLLFLSHKLKNIIIYA